MRVFPVLALTLTAGVVAGGAGAVTVDANRARDFATRADTLQQTWERDLADGVPAASIDPLRVQLQQRRPSGDWWSPAWLGNPGPSLLADLQQRTDAAYAAALNAARGRTQLVLDAWLQEVDQHRQFVSPAEITAAQAWPGQLSAAATPKAVAALAKAWQLQLDTTRTEAAAAEAKAKHAADLAAQLASVGGSQGLLDKAVRDAQLAGQDNLDSGAVPSLITALQQQIASGADATDTASQLLIASQQLDQLIALNDKIAGEVRPIWLSMLQARAEGTPNANSFQSAYDSAQNAFKNGTTWDQLTAVQQQITSLQNNVQTELSSNVCGHNVGAGKVITLSLSLQEAVMYQDGCVVNATPITTGRPALPTPAGNFHVFYKTSPFVMHSSWPKGSPFWYPDSRVSWVLEFDAGGYFLHDAWWEGSGQYGPGGQFGGGASHGCVHIPTPVMQWLYSWTPIGTPVNISN